MCSQLGINLGLKGLQQVVGSLPSTFSVSDSEKMEVRPGLESLTCGVGLSVGGNQGSQEMGRRRGTASAHNVRIAYRLAWLSRARHSVMFLEAVFKDLLGACRWPGLAPVWIA